MNQLVTKKFYIKVNDFEEHELTCRRVIKYNIPKVQVDEFYDFAIAYEFIKNNNIHCCRADYSLFRKKPRIIYGMFDNWCLEEKNFKKMVIKCVYEPVNETLTIKQLMNELPAEQFIEWLKDNGIQNIAINN